MAFSKHKPCPYTLKYVSPHFCPNTKTLLFYVPPFFIRCPFASPQQPKEEDNIKLKGSGKNKKKDKKKGYIPARTESKKTNPASRDSIPQPPPPLPLPHKLYFSTSHFLSPFHSPFSPYILLYPFSLRLLSYCLPLCLSPASDGARYIPLLTVSVCAYVCRGLNKKKLFFLSCFFFFFRQRGMVKRRRGWWPPPPWPLRPSSCRLYPCHPQ